MAASAQAAACKVLFHGSGSYVSAQALSKDGYTVESTGSLTGLTPYLSGPGADLSQYSAIWIHWYNWDPTAADRVAVQNYLAAGGAVHFAVDYLATTSPVYATWLTDILNTRLKAASGGRSISLGGGLQSSPWTLNPNAIADVDNAPYSLGSPGYVMFDNGGALLGNIPTRNRVAYHSYDGATSVAAFDEADMVDGKGRITFFGDTGTLGPAQINDQNMLLVRNLQNFL